MKQSTLVLSLLALLAPFGAGAQEITEISLDEAVEQVKDALWVLHEPARKELAAAIAAQGLQTLTDDLTTLTGESARLRPTHGLVPSEVTISFQVNVGKGGKLYLKVFEAFEIGGNKATVAVGNTITIRMRSILFADDEELVSRLEGSDGEPLTNLMQVYESIRDAGGSIRSAPPPE